MIYTLRMPYNQGLYVQWIESLDRTNLEYKEILVNWNGDDGRETNLHWDSFLSFKSNRDYVSSHLTDDDVLIMDSYFISPLSDDNANRLNTLINEFNCKQIIIFHPDTGFNSSDVFGWNGNNKLKIFSPVYNKNWDESVSKKHYNFYLCNGAYQSDKWLSQFVTTRYRHMLKYKKFMTHNGVYKGHRTLIYDTLVKNDLLKDTFFSYSAYNIFDDNVVTSESYERDTEYSNHMNEVLQNSTESELEEIYSRDRHKEILKELPIVLDYIPNLSNVDQYAFTLPYTCNSYVELIGCTSIGDYGTEIYTSEKIFKPFMSFQIPIFFGQQGLVKHLRRLGFNMFDDIIDNSYDEIENNLERMKVVSELVKTVGSWSREELHNKWNSQLDAMYHNSDVMKELFHLQSENLKNVINGN